MSSTRKTSERPSPAYNLFTEAAMAAEAAEAAEAVIEAAGAEAALRFGGGVAAAAEVAEAAGGGAIE
jgi:hypothetical protein